MSSPVIIYRYDTSPFSVKIDHVLLLKNIPHQKVNVSPALPRPEITDLLGISYRRIPILAIGNDVYCDTSLIASALERRFPASAGYSTIFPPGKHGRNADIGLVKVFSKYYADNVLFPSAPSLLPWEKLPAPFIKDRSLLSGAPIDVQKMVASRDKSLTTLSSHLSLLEEQLSDGREWLFDTDIPSLADISVHFIFDWIKGFRPAKPLFDAQKFPNSLRWLAAVSTFLDKKRATQSAAQPIDGDQAAATIITSAFEPYDVVGFDVTEARRLGVKVGEMVQVAPDDTGRNYPTTGKLVSLNKEEAVIEVQGSKGLLRCHFPRLGYTLRVARPQKL
ncbi:hypothetical protein Hypma_010238 [Hypsizygus marmoreus]|uniref:GST N-terminal domain-containing protein n=1 Tax=Hypsizygus marmoreus TaxID=39966 RepID=A0A369JQ30_HYPMA|nr:hypothetical protein Hypma_010238 [Hypsizygus marmoreus]